MSQPRSALSVLLDLLGDEVRDVIDIGCGAGALEAPLTQAGKRWQGIDPQPAPAAGPSRRQGRAESLPWPDDSFDAAIFVNSLHHVPPAAMADALREAARVTRPNGRIVVVEPKAHGDLSRVIAVVDDETAIRTAARDAVRTSDALTLIDTFDYDRIERFAAFDAFLASLTAADPTRAERARRRGADLRARFDRLGHEGPGGIGLDQPMEVHVLAPAPGPTP